MLIINLKNMNSSNMKQKIDKLSQKDINYENLYSKNPKLKMHRLLRSRMKQFNQKSLVMNNFTNIIDQLNCKKTIENETVNLNQYKNRRYKTSRKSYDFTSGYGNEREQVQKKSTDQKKKSHKTQNNLETIDSMKEKISRSLVKDLLSLSSIQQSLLNKNKKNEIKIKLPMPKNRQTIDYYQCLNLVQKREEQQLILNIKDKNKAPKFSINYSKNKISFLNIFQKKELIHKDMRQKNDKHLSLERKVRLSINEREYGQKNCKSQRKKLQSIEKMRDDQFSPWEIHSRNQLNPELNQQVSFFK